jgi:hypothetical protein
MPWLAPSSLFQTYRVLRPECYVQNRTWQLRVQPAHAGGANEGRCVCRSFADERTDGADRDLLAESEAHHGQPGGLQLLHLHRVHEYRGASVGYQGLMAPRGVPPCPAATGRSFFLELITVQYQAADTMHACMHACVPRHVPGLTSKTLVSH